MHKSFSFISRAFGVISKKPKSQRLTSYRMKSGEVSTWSSPVTSEPAFSAGRVWPRGAPSVWGPSLIPPHLQPSPSNSELLREEGVAGKCCLFRPCSFPNIVTTGSALTLVSIVGGTIVSGGWAFLFFFTLFCI